MKTGVVLCIVRNLKNFLLDRTRHTQAFLVAVLFLKVQEPVSFEKTQAYELAWFIIGHLVGRGVYAFPMWRTLPSLPARHLC